MRAILLLLISAPAWALGESAFFEALSGGRAALLEVKQKTLVAPPQANSTVEDKVLAKLAGALPQAYVHAAFADPRLKLEMTIPPLIRKPAESLTWEQYRKLFMTEERIAAGAAFYRQHQTLLQAVSARYGVEPFLLVGLVGVETYYGRGTGRYEVINALYTIADQVPERETFAVRELAEYLKFCKAENLDVFAVKGSYAGAFGLGQFIPSSFNGYSVDWDGDGKRRWDEWPDMFATISNYLTRNGYARGSVDYSQSSANWNAIYAYNHHDNYVNVVIALRGAVRERVIGAKRRIVRRR